ncbi:MAG: phosphoglycerate kinase [Acidobacteriota bacterium]|jgi:3-phosphoglycerate kinase|nr:phosphoglycerate kinase [Acidobacteriota bacterium]
MKKLSIKDLELKGKKVFIRVDFNVPIKNGEVADDTRIEGALPTIKYAVENGAKVILASHLGRPIGVREDKFSLKPVADKLSEMLGKEVQFEDDCIGEEVNNKVSAMEFGDVLLLENVRFHKGEKENDEDFAKQLAENADVYVNDAFGTAHREHASTAGITKFVEKSAAGLLLEKELEVLGKVLENPERPFVAILGGAKVSDKIPVIKSLITKKVEKLLIGGAMAYTFFKAMGYTVGKSLVEEDMMPTALEIQKQAKEAGIELILPTDHKTVDSYDPLNSLREMPVDFTNTGLVGLDIGKESCAIFENALEGAKTIIWNGPMGMFEEKPFDEGTIAIAQAVAKATENGAFSIVGGGDSVSAINQAGLADKISHISTGGGATLEFLSGKDLPGVSALDNK